MGNKIKILLVEDEIITAMYMRAELEKAGFIITENVTTGEKAISSCKEERPDIILMDIMLAGEIDGIEAASIIKNMEGMSIPVIFCTAYEDSEIKRKAEEIKPLAFLLKPLDMRKLKEFIEKWFTSN